MRTITHGVLILFALIARCEHVSGANDARDSSNDGEASGSEIRITTFHGGKAVVALLSAVEIAKTPQWKPRAGEAVPLSATDASRLAGAALVKQFGADLLVVEAVDLRRYGNSDHWYYVVGFRSASIAAPSNRSKVAQFPDGLVRVVVLTSGHVPVDIIIWPPVGEESAGEGAPSNPPDVGTQNR